MERVASAREPPLICLDGTESQSAISFCTWYRMLAVQRNIERPVRDADNLVAGRANGVADLRHPVILLELRATPRADTASRRLVFPSRFKCRAAHAGPSGLPPPPLDPKARRDRAHTTPPGCRRRTA